MAHPYHIVRQENDTMLPLLVRAIFDRWKRGQADWLKQRFTLVPVEVIKMASEIIKTAASPGRS